MRLLPPLAILLVGAATTASAQTWRPVARQCGARVAAETGCASCSGAWPRLAMCVASHAWPGQFATSRVKRCVGAVAQRDEGMPMSHDRLADVVACLKR